MSYIDINYINLISPRLEKFTKKKDYLYNFRCPYCGDSSKNRNRARGFFYRVKSDMVFKCHNCGMGRTLSNFLKDQDPNLHDQYVLERFKNGLTGKGTVVKNPEINFKTKTFKKNTEDLVSISELNKTHPAREYLESRKIPEERLKEIFYVDKFKKWVNSQKLTFKSVNYDHPRIIIPLIDFDGKWFGFQGRSLNPNSKMRYITVLLDETKPKLFGLNKVNDKQTIYVTEGPLDSLFLCNSIAMCGADVHLSEWGINNVTWIYDNEPRNKQIVERVNKSIQHGDKVVIWPEHVKEKDINDMVLAGHNIQSVVECNTFSGLEAQVKFNLWKKV